MLNNDYKENMGDGAGGCTGEVAHILGLPRLHLAPSHSEGLWQMFCYFDRMFRYFVVKFVNESDGLK